MEFKDFIKLTFEIAQDIKAIGQLEARRVLETQARLIASFNLKKDGFPARNTAEMKDLIETLYPKPGEPEIYMHLYATSKNLDSARFETELKTAQDNIANASRKKFTAPKEVPALVEIAITIGVVKPTLAEAILQCQAAAKTLQALSIAREAKVAQPFTKGGLLKDTDETSRPFIGGVNDPFALTAIQSTNHLTDILAGGIKLDPKLKDKPSVVAALDLLEAQTKRTLYHSSLTIVNNITDKSVQNEIMAMRTEKGFNTPVDKPDFSKTLEAFGEIPPMLPPEKIPAYNNLVSRRLEQLIETPANAA